MVQNMRPHSIFNSVNPKSSSDDILKLVFPSTQPAANLLDYALIVTLSRLIKAKRIFEFGTCVGIGTLVMAMNIPKAKILTFDLEKDELKKVDFGYNQADYEIAKQGINSTRIFSNTRYKKNITQLLGNSMTYDFSRFHKKMDMVFIDGGHGYNTIKRDTENSFRMIKDKNSCVIWHDYNHSIFPDVSKYLDEISEKYKIFYLEESLIAFYLSDPDDVKKISQEKIKSK